MSDEPDPAQLWPDMSPATQPTEPSRWVWDAMEPAERRERLRELRIWVNWLRITFELHNQIPECWYRHKPVREALTALYVGWIRTYAGEQTPGRELAEADWINTLYNITPRLQLATCATGAHEPPPHPPAIPGARETFQAYLSASHDMTAPPRHPAAAEVDRRAQAADPPL
ncbi:hypothetical protein [Streptomyces niveus]|uniref:hypothetical protein n=1 Tax=Streptomyces niveus TaxID=193462 RepID=UPI00342E712D